MRNNKMYFPCCGSKSVSEENLHEDEGSPPESRTRRPNPLIVGLANHLREHHSSARNSAMAGCFGFSDSPPKYEDIYTAARGSKEMRHKREGICNVDGMKTIIADEGTASSSEDDELPPPSYKESVEMASSCPVAVINVAN